ncbi:MAG TPA: inorganic phosphate transporter [Thermoanaerobaculia bacterium]|nr:inorganic phosphate transporter [Thermoanaerobaculia bacterium]HQN38028.1 inorganic phosphate transporter [Thermoanaerobaculia bacterium]HQP92331.1 inorganic phosphate transporter [Thermoanaerobaculia bacterium]
MDTSFFHTLAALALQPWVLLIFAVALVFDFINGFHDAANAIATVVGTRVLRPGAAVVWAAWWNFAAAWGFGLAVANSVAKFVHAEWVTPEVIFAGLLGAIVWGLITWYFGLPTSSSHALLGGFGGAAIAYAGRWHDVVHEETLWTTVAFIVAAPLLGFLLGLFLVVVVIRIFWRTPPGKIDRPSRIIQLASAAAYSLGHGTNDAQKTMGIIAALFYATIWREQQTAFEAGTIEFPFWIVLVCHTAIALGTMAGGWRIVKTMGMKLTRLQPYGGACAETAAAISLFFSSKLGVPVSTTHTIAGAIVGVGSVQRLSAVRWGVAARVVWAWVLTIPMSGLVGVISFYAVHALRGAAGG